MIIFHYLLDVLNDHNSSVTFARIFFFVSSLRMLEIFVSVEVPIINFSGIFTVYSTVAVTDGSLDLEASTVHMLFIVLVPIIDSEISVFSS